jgi:hypothetical protein
MHLLLSNAIGANRLRREIYPADNRRSVMTKTLIGAAATLLLAGCATTSTPTAEQIAQCQAMDAQMGTDATHDHSEAKGITGRSAMNLTHDQCRQIIADAAK